MEKEFEESIDINCNIVARMDLNQKNKKTQNSKSKNDYMSGFLSGLIASKKNNG